MIEAVMKDAEKNAEKINRKGKNKKKDKRENLLADMPKIGTVVATLNSVELARFMSVSADVDAANMADDVPFEKAKAIRIAYRDWWIEIAHRHNINYAWDLTVDYKTGKIYIGK